MGTWSDSLVERTRAEAYPGAMMKSLKGEFGMMRSREGNGVRIVAVRSEHFMPVPTDEVIAEFAGIDEMIKAGWVID